MKNNIFFVIISILLACTGCKKEEIAPIAKVEIKDVLIDASYRTADVYWRVESNATTQAVVFEYSTDSAFTTVLKAPMNKVKTDDKGNLYQVSIDSLQEGTRYYARSMAINKINSYTSVPQVFETKAYKLAGIATDSITDITISSAQLHATLHEWGTDSMPQIGFCVSTHDSVSIADSCLVYLPETLRDSLSYVITLDSLADNTTYYFRAYAKNRKGVSYGEEFYFTTTEIVKPQVGITTITNISYTTATATSEVLSDGGASVTERGVCYSTSVNPTINDNKVKSGTGLGSFTCNLSGLTTETTYYIRAYATNSKGTTYGDEVSFSTIAYGLPTVTTSAATNISYTTATCGGNVTDDGGQNVIERGICYSTTPNPTTANNKIANGSGVGPYTCNMSGLKMGLSYYVRAYAINSKGTAYGEEVSFTTEINENSLYYTALSKLPETTNSTSSGLHTNAFGISIISHEFLEGEGVILFEGKIQEIGNNAFRGCSVLSSITIPNSVSKIGTNAFNGCSSLTSITIPNSVTSIGYSAFMYCSNLTSINIPNSLSYIGKQAFHCYSNLMSVYINNWDIWYQFALGAQFSNAYNLYLKGELVSELVIPSNITYIEDEMFLYCSSLISVEIPNSVISIGKQAFFSCSNLNSVTFPNSLTSIGAEAFCMCTSLTYIDIPNSVTSIGNLSFSGCSSLTSLTIPNSVSSIGNFAFENCNSLTSIRCKALTPPSCGNGVFVNVMKFIPVYVPDSSINAYKQASGWKEFTNILPLTE